MVDEQALRSILATGMHMDTEEYREHIAKHPEVTFFVMCNSMVIADRDYIETNEIQQQVENWLDIQGTKLKSPDSNPNGWWSRAWTEFTQGQDTPFSKYFRSEFCEVLHRPDTTPTRYEYREGVRPLVEKIIRELVS